MRRPYASVFSACTVTVFLTSMGFSQPVETTEQRVEKLLQQMTLEEKVGQMTQVTIDVVSAGANGRQEPHALDLAKLRNALIDHRVGSIINVGPQAHSLKHWQEIIRQIQDVATKETRLKIPVLYGIDAIHGATYTLGATLFPQAISAAATWDPALMQSVGEVTALEIRASGIPWNFYPVMDIGRQPVWPRFWETYGEDVYLGTSMGEAYVKGHQGTSYGDPTKAAACLKHYAGYSYPLNGQDRTPAWIDERTMREYFLPGFEACIRAGVPSVMVNSGEINGIPGHANHHLLTEVLKGEWEFKGFVVSDWEDIKRLHTRDRVAPTPKDAVRLSVMAGVDMSMVPFDYTFYDLLIQCVNEGLVPVARIDDAVRRILTVKMNTGIFERPYADPALEAKFASASSRELNLRSARECLTLLKNDGNVLPLSKGSNILVTGPTADRLSVLNSGWTITWQGDNEALYPKDAPTILDALKAAGGETNVTYLQGSTFDSLLDVKATVAAAKKADAVVLCLGEPAYCETPGNINNLTLNEAQLQLAEAVAATGKPVVLVLAEGRPRCVSRIADRMRAVLFAGLPGMEGGTAVADVLYGVANPSGKLPFSYPRYPNLVVPYDHKPLEEFDTNRYDPQWPFGFGLSYTTFAYSDLKLAKETMNVRSTMDVSVTVKNTGAREGTEVVQLYLTDQFGSVSRPVRQLRRFERVTLKPGESRTVSWTLAPSDLSYVGPENRRIIEPGEFTVSVAGLKKGFVLE
jgi:beta-glucosidase